MKSKVVKTEYGWEPAFWNEAWSYLDEATGQTVSLPADYVVEPGFAKPTRKEAQAALDRDNASSAKIDADDRVYRSGYAYASGYHD